MTLKIGAKLGTGSRPSIGIERHLHQLNEKQSLGEVDPLEEVVGQEEPDHAQGLDQAERHRERQRRRRRRGRRRGRGRARQQGGL